MIIKKYDTCFSLQMERFDWYCRSTYTLQDFIKSIPKSNRRFDWNLKVWIISNSYYKIISEQIQVFTEAEESEADNWFSIFNIRLNQESILLPTDISTLPASS